MSDSEVPDKASAIYDQIVVADKTGFSEHYTIGLAGVRDPVDEAFIRDPERLRKFQGMVFPDSCRNYF